jgi:tetratricopeptide (TPR) repeat protein
MSEDSRAGLPGGRGQTPQRRRLEASLMAAFTLTLLTLLTVPAPAGAQEQRPKAGGGSPGDYSKTFDRGVEFYAAGEYARAAEAFLEVVTLHNPYDPDAHYNLGVTYERMGRGQEAIVSYRRAVSLKPQYQKFRERVCGALVSLGRNWEAIRDCAAAIRLGPKAETYLRFGTALERVGERAQAASAYQTAVRLDPGLAEAHRLSGQALFESGDYAAGLDSLERASRLDPRSEAASAAAAEAKNRLPGLAPRLASMTDPKTCVSLGDALRREGRFALALAAYRRALELKPSAESHYRAGLALYGAGEYREAAAEYRLALKFQPDHAEAGRALDWVTSVMSGRFPGRSGPPPARRDESAGK